MRSLFLWGEAYSSRVGSENRTGAVSAVISDPDKVEDSKKGRKNAFKIVSGRLLKVTFKLEGETAVVITAMVKGEKQDENRI